MTPTQARFEAALAAFVEKIKPDPNILAVIVIGSLTNDTVWEKSDLDVGVFVREMQIPRANLCIEEDGLRFSVDVQTLFEFKRNLERDVGGGLSNSMFTNARVLYSKDGSIDDLLKSVQKLGKDDIALNFFHLASGLLYIMEKIEKWLTVKNDPQYAALWVLQSAYYYANLRLVLDGKPLNREAVLKVMDYAPEFMAPVYVRPMQGPMTVEEVWDILKLFKNFLSQNLDMLSQPVVNYMSDGNARTVSTLEKHFRLDSHGVFYIFDFLEEMGVVARVTETVKITPKSRRAVEEVAYVYIWEEDNSEN